jgi:nucleoside-diphosphate-sugar epimerase
MMWLSEKFPAVILRLFLVYGPGQAENRFIPQVIAGCLRGDTFAVSEGRQIRDFCYIDDIIFGIIEALTCKNVCGEVINLASGVPVSIRSVIEKISKLIGSGTPEYGKIPYRNSENMMLWADTSLAQELLNWSPSIKLEEGLPKVIEHYKKALGKR